MATSKILLASILAALTCSPAIACETASAPGSAMHTHTENEAGHQHNKDCVEADGKPCHLHKHADAAKSDPAGKAALENIKTDVSTAAKPKTTEK